MLGHSDGSTSLRQRTLARDREGKGRDAEAIGTGNCTTVQYVVAVAALYLGQGVGPVYL
jgi:hypothetical protein